MAMDNDVARILVVVLCDLVEWDELLRHCEGSISRKGGMKVRRKKEWHRKGNPYRRSLLEQRPMRCGGRQRLEIRVEKDGFGGIWLQRLRILFLLAGIIIITCPHCNTHHMSHCNTR
jgi:hypothetical protein